MTRPLKEGSKRHRDIYRAFYTTDVELVSYMIDVLDPLEGQRCLEPSAGSGCFVDALLATRKNLRIRAIDVSVPAVSSLREKYAGRSDVDVAEEDFLLADNGLFRDALTFDRIIGNPPYGAWQDYDKRSLLKERYPDLYVRETYGLFLIQSLSRLKLNGRAVFILPETFLYLHLQKGLRRRILEQYCVRSIDVFPSSLFPGVSFGYAKLCIVCIDNCVPDSNYWVQIRHSQTLSQLVSCEGLSIKVQQASILSRQDYSFPLGGHTHEVQMIDGASLRLGDVADCVTGIYTGADKRFLRRCPNNPRGVGKYHVVEPESIVQDNLQRTLEGFSTATRFLPVLKGGGTPYLKPELWFIDWGVDAVRHYKTDAKARFQNSSFYFRRGIGFPMVSSGRATASLLRETWIFDQSVVGVFPRKMEQFGFLLAFLNSTLCWKLLRQINPSTNNSAKYLRKLPIELPSEDRLQWFSNVVLGYVTALQEEGKRDSVLEQKLDKEIDRVYAASHERVTRVRLNNRLQPTQNDAGVLRD